MGRTVKMKAKRPSKVVKPKVGKKQSTGHTKNHRFQSFNERIANFKIDPVRRRRYIQSQEEASQDTATYFGKALEEWRDLNLSKNFTAFAREAGPLCESLPVVLHNEEKIMDLLVKNIERGDNLSLEPLLDLLSHFAHDLDTRFEKHFPRAVTMITQLASTHSDPAVIEWSFTRLAWLFKYLSRVIIPDLRPLYDLMSPYLGKEIQKPFIIRFAAESMSFLIRKAATRYKSDPEPLDLIISHVVKGCADEAADKPNSLHVQGVMTMLTEAMTGVQRDLHSAGLSILNSVLGQFGHPMSNELTAGSEILPGLLTCLIHHTDVVTFQPLFETILDYVNNSVNSMENYTVRLASSVLFVTITVRKGSRIADWTRVMETLESLVDVGSKRKDWEAPTRKHILSVIAAAFQAATIDAVLPALALLQSIRGDEWKPYFLQFCDLFSRLGRERFQQFLLPGFQKFILEEWENNETAISFYLPKLAPFDRRLHYPQTFQTSLLARIDGLGLEDALVASNTSNRLGDAQTALYALRYADLTYSISDKLTLELLKSVRRTLERTSSSPEYDRYALGPCFSGLLDQQASDGFYELWSSLCVESSRFMCLPAFWSNLQRYMTVYQQSERTPDLSNISSLKSSILQALSLPSHEIRQAALEVAESAYRLQDRMVPECLSVAIGIESTPISLDTSRSISMNLRRLGMTLLHERTDDFMQRAIPSYCFGVLHLQLAQAWKDATETLAQLSKNSVCEEVIVSLAQTWLNMDSSSQELERLEAADAILDSNSSGFHVDSEFECPNLAKLSAVSGQAFSQDGGHPSLAQEFQRQVQLVPFVATNAREQALRVLNKIPSLAEKRSRMLVPVLLRWALSPEADADTASQTQRWSRKDQKALLSVFAQFTNPRVLFKSAEVYTALLNLCANGDAEIQRSALKAIYAWKDPAVNSYEEHLNNLLDEARFRDEISVFLQGGYEDAVVQFEHQDKLMPVLLRVLYGRVVSRGKEGQSSRRKAIFTAISRYDDKVLEMFIGIALGPLVNPHLIDNNKVHDTSYTKIDMSLRQQYGMLNMMSDLLEGLGSTLEAFAGKILDSVLICSVAASRKLDGATSDEQNLSLLRSIRQAGLQCIVKVFASVTESAFPIHAQVILDELFSPRQTKFATENTQSVSAMLRLLSVFASSPQSGPYLSKHSDNVLERLAELLREPAAKDEVRTFVLQDILDALVTNEAVAILTQEHVTNFVRSIGEVLKSNLSKAVIDACVSSLTSIASWIEEENDGLQLIEVCADLLNKPQKLVSPPTKAGLLKVLSSILDLTSGPAAPALYDALCGLFSRLHDVGSRALLSEVVLKVCKSDSSLLKSARICEDLNSQGDRLDEPDHERRERGFNGIFQEAQTFTLQQWQPMLQNCLFFLRDDADIVNRTSSSQALCRFIDTANTKEDLRSLVLNALLPGIEHGVKHDAELVRAEFLHVLGHLVANIPDLPAVSDMKSLTVSGDDEASVFTNVLHIQQHRRLRALRRLAEEAINISSTNVMKLFIPLLEHFIFNRAEGDAGRTLADQTILTVGALGQSLTWASFRATFRRYVGYLSSKPEQEAIVMRLLSALVDSIAPGAESKSENMVVETSLKKQEDIKRDILSPLMDFIHLKDESTIDRRMPVAVTIVKLLLLLPKEDFDSKLAPVLTDVCQILRSHSQEARDQTRKTLAAILALVGPSYLGFILKELRGALKRGSQLHVLSFTVHSLLVGAVESYKPGDLDYCLPELAAIIMDDIFGVTGLEKDSEDYRSKLKEVKSSKSFDTMELLARVTPVQKLAQLVQPLRALLSESMDSKALTKADNLLARLRNGVEQNPAAQSRDALLFCHEIIRQVHHDQQRKKQRTLTNRDAKHNRYIIQPEAGQKSKRKSTTLNHNFKLAEFALNLLRKVLRRHDNLMTASNLAGFLPLIGDALVEGHEEIQVSAIKILSTIMNVELHELERNASVYAKEAVRMVKSSAGINGNGSRAALDLLTAILRERRSVAINDRDIGHVFQALQTEIDEPDRQGAVYKFLRAVLNRKIMVTEVYELMDNVGRVSVTNADRGVRESARSAYVQFIVEYPFGKDRWNKQATFLVENLRYEHASGRQSVMELLNQLLPKLPDDVIEQLALPLFIHLVPVLSGDSDSSCQQMAAILIGKLFERVDSKGMDSFLSLLEKWASRMDKPTVRAAAFQCWRVALQKVSLSGSIRTTIRDSIADELQNGDTKSSGEDLNPLLSALETLQMLISKSLDIAFASQSSRLWQSVQTNLLAGDSKIQEKIAHLVEAYFSHLASSSFKTGVGLFSLPLKGSFGLELNAGQMRQICQSSLRVMFSDEFGLTETLVSQTVRNIAFLGRCFAANGVVWATTDEDLSNGQHEDVVEHSAISHLFNRLSYITRQENAAVLSRTAAIQCEIALLKQLDEIPDIVGLVKPLYMLTDPSVPRPNDEAHRALTEHARELLDIIQQKSGAETYVSALGEARNHAKERREERRQKRKIAAVSKPEQWAKAKKRKHEVQRARGKADALFARGKRRGW